MMKRAYPYQSLLIIHKNILNRIRDPPWPADKKRHYSPIHLTGLPRYLYAWCSFNWFLNEMRWKPSWIQQTAKTQSLASFVSLRVFTMFPFYIFVYEYYGKFILLNFNFCNQSKFSNYPQVADTSVLNLMGCVCSVWRHKFTGVERV